MKRRKMGVEGGEQEEERELSLPTDSFSLPTLGDILSDVIDDDLEEQEEPSLLRLSEAAAAS